MSFFKMGSKAGMVMIHYLAGSNDGHIAVNLNFYGNYMKPVKKLSGVALATAAAALFVAGCASHGGTGYSATGQVQCMGVNGCKGQSDCKNATNDCKGKNGCRYEGFLYMDPYSCWRAQGEARAYR